MLSQTLLSLALVATTSFVVALPARQQAAITTTETTYNIISPDGTCGGETPYTCTGSQFGDCCSTTGFCGSSQAFCGTTCFNQAGLCAKDFDKPQKVAAVATPQATHLPWKPTPHRDPLFKPSYKIDNGERAPNQVWS